MTTRRRQPIYVTESILIAAVSRVLSEVTAVILMDLKMPEMGVLAASRWLKGMIGRGD